MRITPSLLSDQTWISPQVQSEDVDGLRIAGFTILLNHRPDGEEPGQPTARDISMAAAAVGMRSVHAPCRGFPDEAVVAATRDMLDGMGPEDKALMFCRSGMRSACAWALAKRADGVATEDVRDAAMAAGYDLSRVPL